MDGYHVVRVAVDALGQPISGAVECVEHRCGVSEWPDEVGPFDAVGDVVGRLVGRLDRQLSLW